MLLVLIVSKSKMEIKMLKTQLNQQSKMKNLGEARKTPSMEICRDKVKSKTSLTKKLYLKKPIQRFGFTKKSKPISTLLTSHFKLSVTLSHRTNVEHEYMPQVFFSNAVGSLMYDMVCIGLDIS